MKVATSIVLGNHAAPELAGEAVRQAMQKAGISVANSVLLLLTSEFASNPQPAIKAAAKAANSLQVIGCSATGIFTEEDWVLDAPAAAAMVFCEEVSLQAPGVNHEQQPLLTYPHPMPLIALG
jgi:small ligand-binding sensory domain FIST